MAETRYDVTRQLRLTRLGLWAERVTHAFWPAWTAGFAALAVWASGVVPEPWEFGLIAILGVVALALILLGLCGFQVPDAAEARARLDATLPGRPLATLDDDMAVGADDAQSAEVWAAHRMRMTARLAGARAVAPDLRVSRRDPYALRYMAVLLAALALMFGTIWRAPALPGAIGGGTAAASGPTWEGWLEPPRHTGQPTLYLADVAPGAVTVPEGTRVVLRLYGEIGALSVAETVSVGREAAPSSEASAEAAATAQPANSAAGPDAPMQDFTVARSGTLTIDGAEEAPTWTVTATPDAAPTIAIAGEAAYEHPDLVTLPWSATDDYGVTGAEITLALDADAADRRFGLAVEPEPREPLRQDMALPISGDRDAVTETFRGELTKHPLAGMPVNVTLRATDAAGQEGVTEEARILPSRAFYDPVAAALIEQRRDLNWSRANRDRVRTVLRAVTWQADGTWANPAAYLIVRMAIRRLDAGPLTVETRDEVAEMLWQAAVRLDENSLDSALERLRQAQDRLSEAIRQGAPPEEIERLMAEMREAMDEYTRQLAEQGEQGQEQQQAQGETQEITPDMLDEMMQRIEELMQQGRTAEAQELLRQLQEMMENMQVTQGQGGGQGGQGQPGQGEQAMDELRDQLREQQDLSDEAFRQLQEQFGQSAPPPGAPGQGEQPGQQGQGQQGQGQQGQGQQGQGESGQGQQGQSGQNGPSQSPGQGQGEGQGEGQPDARSLAERQDALRRGLEGLRGNLPGAGSEAGDAAREALERAEEAMRDAERDLADGNLGGALDDQSRAMDALREGMQELGRAMAGDQPPGGGEGQGRGEAAGRNGRGLDRDPLGRQSGEGGRLGTEDSLLGEEDAARRSRELLDEIRRRSGERNRPKLEQDYLRRLLDRF